jgi:DNA-binding response OmpR family regulator
VRRLHILLVDSDPNVYARIERALGNGFLLLNVESLTEAIHYIEEYIPDVLICEVVLGQESGLDLCRYVRRSPSPSLRHLPIMILTSLTTLQDKVAGFDAGADDYIVKPFDARHLAARIRLLLRIKRLQQPNPD